MGALLGRGGLHVEGALAHVLALADPPGPVAVVEAVGRPAHQLVDVPVVERGGAVEPPVDALEDGVAAAEEGLVGAGQLHPVTAGQASLGLGVYRAVVALPVRLLGAAGRHGEPVGGDGPRVVGGSGEAGGGAGGGEGDRGVAVVVHTRAVPVGPIGKDSSEPTGLAWWQN